MNPVFRNNRKLLLLLCSRVSSTLAYQVLAVAVGWQIYTLTGSPLYLGLVGFAQFLPMFLLTLIAGHAADRYDRRKVIRTCQFVEAAGVAVLAAGSFSGWLNGEVILGIAFVVGAARTFENPGVQALLPNLVPNNLFPRAVAWSASCSQVAFIVGPAAGGFLYALDPAITYVTVGCLFVGAGVVISLIRVERPNGLAGSANVQSLFAGIAFIRANPAILGAISLDLFAVLLGGATALLPVYARDILFVGPWGLGFLRSSPALGALAMSIGLARRPLQSGIGRTMFVAVIVFGIATISFALSTSFALSLVSLAVLGAADVVSVVIRQSLVQMKTPMPCAVEWLPLTRCLSARQISWANSSRG